MISCLSEAPPFSVSSSGLIASYSNCLSFCSTDVPDWVCGVAVFVSAAPATAAEQADKTAMRKVAFTALKSSWRRGVKVKPSGARLLLAGPKRKAFGLLMDAWHDALRFR